LQDLIGSELEIGPFRFSSDVRDSAHAREW